MIRSDRSFRPFRRRVALLAALAVATLTSVVAGAPGSSSAALPTAAVALGDSFISGEGAGAYQAVPNAAGTPQGDPGFSAANSNAFFCHRSANASINVANLNGISARFNLACSGGQPHDMANPSAARASGRDVAAQIDQLRAVAQTHDIDLVLIGLGSNNSSFTFGSAAAECAGRFISDAWIGWWEFWVPLASWWEGEPVPSEDPCTDNDLATAAELAAATDETAAAVAQILAVLDEIDADGQHRIVLQDYTNPLPPEFDDKFYNEDRRTDTRDKFRALGAERYAGGCPAHRASLAPAHRFSANLGTMVHDVFTRTSAQFPGDDLAYLNVQQAFNGARLCEQSNSPSGALATPVRVTDASGNYITSISGYDKNDINRLFAACQGYFQRCQESWHPNAAGHSVLGQCLAGAWTTTNDQIACARQSNGAILVTSS